MPPSPIKRKTSFDFFERSSRDVSNFGNSFIFTFPIVDLEQTLDQRIA
jgi:hypothetical protein